ncbi:dimethyl sulfoxide reductase chain YnfE [Escherichia coli]|uniref:Dimethyl sulfoxide reductase chain YnfE n=1 Tax=Escherichia coli TaxID=562 RepID=A0A376TF36_ECOLX|nr:dimethyl sulfoxide reductase chain YnfE [Escherichia coli]
MAMRLYIFSTLRDCWRQYDPLFAISLGGQTPDELLRRFTQSVWLYSTAQISCAMPYTYGSNDGNSTTDIENSKLVVMFGNNPAENPHERRWHHLSS